jgi:hypothetical protein
MELGCILAVLVILWSVLYLCGVLYCIMRRNAVAMGTILFLLVRSSHLLSFIHDSVLNNHSAPTFSGELFKNARGSTNFSQQTQHRSFPDYVLTECMML